MKIYRLGDSEQNIIIEALDNLKETESKHWDVTSGLEKEVLDYKLSHIQTTKALIQDTCLQELVEKLLGYVWDIYVEYESIQEDMMMLMEEMGISKSDFESRFKVMGYEREK